MLNPATAPPVEDGTVQTFSGRYVNVLEPDPETIDIVDIAVALSRLARFNGHTRRFYSVAQHSVFVSCLVPRRFALMALLHDGAEAYIGDMVRPVKAQVTQFRLIDHKLQLAIWDRFGAYVRDDDSLRNATRHAVDQADRVALATERRDLMPLCPRRWPVLDAIEPDAEKITPLSSDDALRLFAARWFQLTGESPGGRDWPGEAVEVPPYPGRPPFWDERARMGRIVARQGAGQ